MFKVPHLAHLRRVGRKHRQSALYDRIFLIAVHVSIRDHLGDHVLAGFSVMLDVNEPRRFRIGLSMLRSLTRRRHDNSLRRFIRCLLDYEQIGICKLLLRSCRLHNGCAI
jgi:hypothetical protein